MRGLVLLTILALGPWQASAENTAKRPRMKGEGNALVDAATIRNVVVELRYATSNNFLKKRLYPATARCWLHRITATKLRRAASQLARTRPGAKLLLLDCLRPLSVQEIMWKSVAGTKHERYVGKPKPPNYSLHNKGFAVDLTIVENGKPLDMGTVFDHFGQLAHPRLDAKHLKSGLLSKKQYANRQLLRRVMRKAGFRPLAIEWWHFAATTKLRAERYPVYRDFPRK